MENKKSEIFNKISTSLEERTGKDRRESVATAEYINDELDRRKDSRREASTAS